MGIRKLIAFLIVAGFCVNAAWSQSVDDIIKKHIDALGGSKKIEAIKTLKITGTTTRGGGNFSMEIDFTRFVKQPNMVRNEMEMRGNMMVQAFDGETAWAIIPFRSEDPQELTGPQAQSIINQAEIGSPLANYKDKGFKVELLGKEEFEGTEVFKIKVTGKENNTFISFLDAEHFIEIKRVAQRVGRNDNTIEIESLFSDFKPVDGIMMPHSITTKGGGGFGGRGGGRGGRAGRGGGRGGRGSEITIKKYEVNVELDNKIFKMPGK